MISWRIKVDITIPYLLQWTLSRIEPILNYCRAMAGGKSVSENYAFAGMHHIFDQHTDAGEHS